jgi:hypothetical protein
MLSKPFRARLRTWSRRVLWAVNVLLAIGVASEIYRDRGWSGLAVNLALAVAFILVVLVLDRWAETRWRRPKKDRGRPVLNLTKD